MEGSAAIGKTVVHLRKLPGASPAVDRYYVLVLFDISDQKKYRHLVRVINKFCLRAQKSVFEGYLTKGQIGDLSGAIESLMFRGGWQNDEDNVRIYVISANCEVVVLGKYDDNFVEEDIFL